MSRRLVSRNTDLSQLLADGYDVIVGPSNHLLVRDVPYVTPAKEVKRGIIVSDLDLAGEVTTPPKSHVVFFVGECPCDEHGSPLPGVSPNTNKALGDGLTPNHQISRKPTGGPTPGKYPDYYQKIRTLIAIVSSPAQAIFPKITPATRPVIVPDDDDETAVFKYVDTAATKAGIVVANEKLEGAKIAIVGVGGTGSYVLDLVAKTPVAEIHLFDDDDFLNHNAFRTPGAASLDDLEKRQKKVSYLADVYSKMRKQVISHECQIDDSTIAHLKDMNFVFVCIDAGGSKQLIVEHLEGWDIPFVDVGMGIQLGDDNKLGGIIAITTSTERRRDHLRDRVAFADEAANNEYSRNVQIAELSALSASLAVIKWKKLFGYYDDQTHEHFSAYTIRSNHLVSEDVGEA